MSAVHFPLLETENPLVPAQKALMRSSFSSYSAYVSPPLDGIRTITIVQ